MAKTFKDATEKALYTSWKFVKRTQAPNDKDYPLYGARGIKVCPDWNDFASFYAWALNSGFKPGMVLRRKDSNGDFCPENCFFADKTTAGGVIRKNSRVLEYEGQKMSVEQFSRLVNINPHKVLKHLNAGESPEQIVANRKPTDKYIAYGHSENSTIRTDENAPNQPFSRSSKMYTLNGVTAPLSELCKLFGNGITRKEAQRRISKGWPLEKAVLTPVNRKEEKADSGSKEQQSDCNTSEQDTAERLCAILEKAYGKKEGT